MGKPSHQKNLPAKNDNHLRSTERATTGKREGGFHHCPVKDCRRFNLTRCIKLGHIKKCPVHGGTLVGNRFKCVKCKHHPELAEKSLVPEEPELEDKAN
ncbi:hypothetical protein N7492_004327 [Penicillium capsulatum]|uniref:Uncharacterized protein n=1 Tax=Penicillium capsulatum TaxID=69766 RepID=A0A9W9I7F0_9EURO|nr:hypothetical protein N7492_004327 [Penicillium capsulatum]KAJ6136555.1 hypothetical protein N7512_001715 [Penicillium capsulatum]